MREDSTDLPAFVIKPEELAALNYLDPDHPRPLMVEWINRGTNQKLKSSSVDMLLRTLAQDVLSPSAVRLYRSAGLRVVFSTERERERFASEFAAARSHESAGKAFLLTAIFDGREYAEKAVLQLKDAGIPDISISLLWRASQFLDTDFRWGEGNSKLSVASAVAGGGIAGAVLGVALLTVPGIGPVAAAGAIASTAIQSVASVGAAIGATGGAIARMLTDYDVDGVSANYYEQQIRRGRIFVSVDTRIADGKREIARRILTRASGRVRSMLENDPSSPRSPRVLSQLAS